MTKPKPGRRACCVPFCRRTAKLEDGVEEIICSRHYRAANPTLRRRYGKAVRKLTPLLEQPPESYDEATRDRIADAFRLVDSMWREIKRQAIEAAVGIA